VRIFSSVKQYKWGLALVPLLLLAVFLRSGLLDLNIKGADIFYHYAEAMRIKAGENPYQRIVGQGLLRNRKYPTLFPSAYLLILGLSALVRFDFTALTFVLRSLIVLADILIVFILLRIARDRGLPFLGLGAAIFWLFNRWSLYNFAQARLDTIVLSLVLLAVYLYHEESRFWPFLVMGVSLSIKHIGVFILPLFFFDALRRKDFGKLVTQVLILSSVPVIFSLPFVFRNPLGFLSSMGFSLTRVAASPTAGASWAYLLDKYRGKLLLGRFGESLFLRTFLYYFFPRLPLFIGFSLVTVFAYLENWGKYIFAFVGLLVFLATNPVIFSQYFSWILPFAFVAGIETFSRKRVP